MSSAAFNKIMVDLNMKKICLCILAILMALSVAEGWASWLIDEESFHTSVHGQLSCSDCHTDIFEKQLHPDPNLVGKSLVDFFRLDKCRDCHEDVIDEIEQTRNHAGSKDAEANTF